MYLRFFLYIVRFLEGSLHPSLQPFATRLRRLCFYVSIKTLAESEETSVMRQNTAEYTPRKRVEEFIRENIPHIETPKKEVIKQKLLEHILTEALKLEM